MKSKESKIGALLVSHWVNDGYSVILPSILVLIAIEFSLSTIQTATIISAFTIASAIVQLPLAFYSDYSGKYKQVLAGGLFIFSIALIGYGYSPTYSWLVLFAFIGGVGFSGYHPISMNLMTQQFSDRKGFSLGIFTVVGSLGAAMVPIIIGLFDKNWNLGVWLLASMGMFVGLWILWAFESHKYTKQNNRTPIRILKKTLINPALILTTVFSGITQMVYWGFLTFIPLLFTYHYGWSTLAIATLIGVFHFSALISQPLLGYLSDVSVRNHLLFVVGTIIMIVSILMAIINNASLAAFFTVIIGATTLAVRPLVNAKIADIVDSQARSTAIGLGFTINSGLAAIAPILGGYLAERYSYQMVFMTYGVITLGGLSILIILNQLEKRLTISAAA